MRLSKTIAKLNRTRAALRMPAAQADGGRLGELEAFDNPGNLRGFQYVPGTLKAPAALVVVLHGCTQSAAGYDRGSGWSGLAERHGFALLFPEQQRANNANLCFNWFESGDTARGRGEAASIAAMVERMRVLHGLDPARIFVTGLSAGGAMASVMLATYPETFAAGAIIAGLPFGCAANLAQAFGCMGGHDSVDPVRLGDRVRRASSHKGPWPRVSVWHGGADQMVDPGNADAIVAQWRNLHDLPETPTATDSVEGYPHSVWSAGGGVPLVELYTIAGMAHGTPLAPGTGDGRSGEAGPHMLDAAISSTDRIAAFFGVAPAAKAIAAPPTTAVEAGATAPRKRAAPRTRTAQPPPVGGAHKIIEDALRAAGLMR